MKRKFKAFLELKEGRLIKISTGLKNMHDTFIESVYFDEAGDFVVIKAAEMDYETRMNMIKSLSKNPNWIEIKSHHN